MKGVIGVDEVGRGCWAGPLLVVAAKAKMSLPVGLKDSKLLNRKRREELFDTIVATCQLGDGWVEAAEIDQLGLTGAMRLGVERALFKLGADLSDEIIMDGQINYCPLEFTNVETIIDADATHPIVSAASIYAKVLRDKYMIDQATVYPDYGFEKHVGYGTKLHSENLKLHGACDLHRKSYKPIKEFLV